jgi:hypothetical protein
MAYSKPIQINPDASLRKRIKEEADSKKWKLGPTVLEIVRLYFSQKDAHGNQAESR